MIQRAHDNCFNTTVTSKKLVSDTIRHNKNPVHPRYIFYSNIFVFYTDLVARQAHPVSCVTRSLRSVWYGTLLANSLKAGEFKRVIALKNKSAIHTGAGKQSLPQHFNR